MNEVGFSFADPCGYKSCVKKSCIPGMSGQGQKDVINNSYDTHVRTSGKMPVVFHGHDEQTYDVCNKSNGNKNDKPVEI